MSKDLYSITLDEKQVLQIAEDYALSVSKFERNTISAKAELNDNASITVRVSTKRVRKPSNQRERQNER